jgi:hypothetical protein
LYNLSVPPTQLAIRKNEDLATYPGLFRQVKAVLLDGQRRIENERIFTFWDAGRLIRTHILLNQERAEYGKGVILKLAQDLHVSRQVLDRCVQFFETYPKFPIGARARQLTWSHYQELIAVADDKKRLLLEKAIITSGLTRDEVRARKKAQQPSEPTTSLTPEVRKVAPLVPLRGELYTYKILKPKPSSTSAFPSRATLSHGWSRTSPMATSLPRSPKKMPTGSASPTARPKTFTPTTLMSRKSSTATR